nr:YHYH protein [Verrucomicrobiales bacterium]
MKSILLSALITTLLVSNTTNAHEWKRNESPGDREALRQHVLDEFLAKRQATQKKEVRPLQLVSSSSLVNLAAAIAGAANAPLQSVPFQVFPKLELKWDDDFLYVGSNGLPDHNMMVGITAWQQQVPLPQAYVGENAWRIPLHPVPAKTPAQIEGHFLRGAIALAVNGIPIFNPQNNRGEVSYEIGELDQWGGHCGRADDYHYHIAPLHLQEVVGEGKPIAYALDGYPIYGLTEPDGSPVKKLDECHGHDDAGIGYHYHASKERPYLQSAFYGEVVEAGGQVDPQPRAQGVRPDTAPLRGAEITGFESTGENRYKLSYEVSGEKRSIAYEIKEDGTYPFEFDNGSEGKVSEVYTRRAGGGGGPGGPGAPGSGAPGSGAPGGKGKGKGGKGKSEEGKGMRPEEDSRPPRPEEPRPPRPQASNPDLNGDGIVSAREFADAARREFSAKGGQGTMPDAMARARDEFNTLDRNRDGSLDATEVPSPEAPKAGEPMARRATSPESSFSAGTGFVLTSPEVEDGGNLPADYTGDGSGATLPLEWKGAPSGTKSYALIMDHLAPGNEMKGYWTMWGIPADVTSLPKNVEGVGKLGVGFKGEIGYEPPHSQGPGAKTYVLHVYALSAEPEIAEPADNVSREVLLAAIEDKILAQADLSVVYTRGGEPGGGEPGGSKSGEGRKGMAPGEAQRPEQPGNRPQPPSA